jgi:hypothetical protein
MDLQPKILLHPNIPKPLHGIAPREIYGRGWWDKQRQAAYKKNNYCCWACGIDKNNALYYQWLEAHEIYDVDYSIGEAKFIGVSALCHVCHNFIHSGRLVSLYRRQEVDLEKITTILRYGFGVLKDSKLKMNPFALKVAKEVDESLFKEYFKYGFHEYGVCLAKWDDWYMLIDGKKYKGKFKSLQEWADYYK